MITIHSPCDVILVRLPKSLPNGFSAAEWKTLTDLSDFVKDGVDCMFLLPSRFEAPLRSETP
jgi:hypothetical protein